MASYKHIVTNQKEYDDMISQVNYSEDGSHHLICFYGHGNKNTDNFITTIDPKASPRCIFIKDDTFPSLDLNYVIKTALEDGKFIYIIAISCEWNEKYKKGLTIPTISFAPDEISNLPFMFSSLERRINCLDSNFNKEIMVDWFKNLKKEFNKHMNLWENHDDKTGKVITPGGYILKYADPSIADDDNWESLKDEDDRIWKNKRSKYNSKFNTTNVV
tara:strand:- start:7639 stop:8289 length:651 start_codon:yes stop_codon:yes gene_type:complete